MITLLLLWLQSANLPPCCCYVIAWAATGLSLQLSSLFSAMMTLSLLALACNTAKFFAFLVMKLCLILSRLSCYTILIALDHGFVSTTMVLVSALLLLGVSMVTGCVAHSYILGIAADHEYLLLRLGWPIGISPLMTSSMATATSRASVP